MNQALEAAQTDIQFQFFLARLFGQFSAKADLATLTEVQGYEWRGRMYNTKFIHHMGTPAQPTPNQDSRP